jgi:Ca2+-binding RTX toxin-like protein
MRSRTIGFITLTMLAMGVFVSPTSAGAAAPTCHGREATIVITGNGASGYGTSGDDVIVATGRDSWVSAEAGDDLVCLVDGRVRAGPGHDFVEARGTDRFEAVSVTHAEDLDISLGAGTDKLSLWQVSRGTGTIDAGPGEAELFMLRQRSVDLDLEDQRLTLDGSGTYELVGFQGAWAIARQIRMVGDRDANRLRAEGTACDVSLAGGRGADTLSIIEEFSAPHFPCTPSSPRLFGQGGDDELRGRQGDEVLVGGSGEDTARGGKGTDTCRAEREIECER